MNLIKRSFNIDAELEKKIDQIISQNPSYSFTIIVNKALSEWVKNPIINLEQKQFRKEDVEEFLEENSELFDALGKIKSRE